jgi:TctA family transporter
MIKADGDFLGFFSRPIAATLGILVILLWLGPLIGMIRRRLQATTDAVQ